MAGQVGKGCVILQSPEMLQYVFKQNPARAAVLVRDFLGTSCGGCGVTRLSFTGTDNRLLSLTDKLISGGFQSDERWQSYSQANRGIVFFKPRNY
jgi:hypothetical protein